MAESKTQTSFAAGELSPNLYARVDLDKFTVGAALMRNFFVDWRGGASNRAGTAFAGLTKSLGARLIPFEFSTSITYMMEFGDHYIRFYSNAQRVTEPSFALTGVGLGVPVTLSIPGHNFSTGDWLVIQNLPGIPQLNNRTVLAVSVVPNYVSLNTTYGVPISGVGMPPYISGGTVSRVYEIPSPYALADVFSINYTQSADVVTLVHPLYPPQDLSRTAATPTFTIVPEVIGPQINPPTNLSGTPTSIGNKHNYGYVVTAVNEKGTEESLPSAPSVVPAALLDETGASGVPAGTVTVVNLTWSAPAGQVVSTYNIYKWGPVLNSSGIPATVFGYIGTTKATAFQDANIAPDFSKTPNDYVNPFAPGQILNLTLTNAGGTGYTGSYVPLTITGDGTGATGYGIVDYATGAVAGVVLTNGGSGYTHATVTDSGGGATYGVEIGPNSGTYPSVVSFVQQRRVFAAPINNPEGMELSQIGQYNNFDTSPIVIDSDAITLDLASGVVNYIESMTPMAAGLVILTSGGAFLLSGGSPGTPITPSNITATRQASHGANSLPALVINYDVLYMQNKGNTVRDLAFNFYLQSYVGNDRSTLSAHLFTDFNFVEWAWAQEPLKIVSVVRSDGVLLTMTYVPEQEVYGWAQHDTQGLFRSVAVISEGTADATYVIVRRYIPGSGWYDMVERMSNRRFDCVEDVWFVDCGVMNPKNIPNYDLYLVGTTLSTPNTSGPGPFAGTKVGDIVQVFNIKAKATNVTGTICGKFQVTSVTNVYSVQVEMIQPVDLTVPGDPTVNLPIYSGNWMVNTPTTAVWGLSHLEGKTVVGLADGMVVGPFTVQNAGVTLPFPATNIVIGLAYSSKLQTLYLDAQGQQNMQGRRKTIPACTLRLAESRGPKIGRTFDELDEMEDLMVIPGTTAMELVTGDFRAVLMSDWEVTGQVCVEQDYPLPLTVLGIIPEFVRGDTSN